MAIRSLDEHWDGSGYPQGLRGEEIPLLARILGLAQTVEVFWKKGGIDTGRRSPPTDVGPGSTLNL